MEKPSTPLREGVEGFLPMNFRPAKGTRYQAGRGRNLCDPLDAVAYTHLPFILEVEGRDVYPPTVRCVTCGRGG